MAEGGAETTTGGAGLVQTNAYLTAAAVMIYTTRALWLKLRKMLAAENKENKDQETPNTIDKENKDQETPNTIDGVNPILKDGQLKDCGIPLDLNTF